MGTQRLSLNWNNQETNMIEEFQQLLSSESFLDVTLACEGLSLKAHKMVLSASSSLFQDLFLENPCQHPIVILIDVEYRDLKALVQFMYRGQIDIKRDRLSKFLKTAEKLKIKGLSAVTDNTIIAESEERSSLPSTSVTDQLDTPLYAENCILPEDTQVTQKTIGESDNTFYSEKNHEQILNIKVESNYSPNESKEMDSVSSNNYWTSDCFSHGNLPPGDWNGSSAKTSLSYSSNLDPLSHKEHTYAKRNGERGDLSYLHQNDNGRDLLSAVYTSHPADHLLTPSINSSIEDIIESINGHLSQRYQNAGAEYITPSTQSVESSATSSSVIHSFRNIARGRRRSSGILFICKVCGKRFQQKWHLIRHERIHTGERPYSCIVCQKRFVQKGDLHMHLRIHSGEKPYSCNTCGKKCRTSSDLTVHKKVHTGEKPHSCELCKKRFIQKSDLVRHLRAHRGERPYSCSMCDKTFARTWNLKMHAAKVHSLETSSSLLHSL